MRKLLSAGILFLGTILPFSAALILRFSGLFLKNRHSFKLELFCYKSQQMIVLNKKQFAHCLFEHNWAIVDETLQHTEKSLNFNGCTKCKSKNWLRDSFSSAHLGVMMKVVISRETIFRHYFAIFGGTNFTFFGTIFEKSALIQT